MKSITLPFEVNINNDLLHVIVFYENKPMTLCLIGLSRPFTFAAHAQGVIYLSPQGQTLIPVPEVTSTPALLDCITTAVTRYERHKDKSRRRRLIVGTLLVVGMALCTGWALSQAANSAASGIQDHPVALVAQEHSVPQDLPQNTRNTQPAAHPMASEEPVVGSQSITAGTPLATVEAPPSDGWTLPKAIRASLPANLRFAAEQKVFTVEYSSGHPRTLYVFADPECPNCQRLEPALEEAAKDFNVIVFPVAVIGRDRSIASITPVLCLPPEQRKAAWSNLFDIGHGVMELGKTQQGAAVEPGHCDIASKALGVNEVGYQTYRIPGTPWAIADDGRHVSQEVLQNPLQLQAFMGAAEVSHAAQ